MKNLFNQTGDYNFRSFIGKNGSWTIIGTESIEDTDYKQARLNWTETHIGRCKDTFKSDKGEYLTMNRSAVFDLYCKGKIKPIEDSLITSSSSDKRKGRAI